MKKIIYLIPFFFMGCGSSDTEKQKMETGDSVMSKIDTTKLASVPESSETEQAIKEAEKRVNEKEKRETN